MIPRTNNMGEIKRLLINAWSAEYALRLTPIGADDEEYKASKATWVIPQTYYSTLFMVRAFLTARMVMANGQEPTANEEAIMYEVDNLIDAGIYPVEGCWREPDGRSFLAKLAELKSTTKPVELTIPIVELVRTVERINGWHERAIVDLVGVENYSWIIRRLPHYLFDSVLANRIGQP